MRMWNVEPKIMCRQHLLGEHLEMHMFAGTLRKGKPIDGWAKRGQCISTQIKQRHDELMEEMVRRGYNHKSPMDVNPTDIEVGWVDPAANLVELANRCTACAELQDSA